VEGAPSAPELGSAAERRRAPAAGHELAVNGPRGSLRGGTRKMVNYA